MLVVAALSGVIVGAILSSAAWWIGSARWTPSGTCATESATFAPDQPTPRTESGASKGR